MIKHDVQSTVLLAGTSPTTASISVASISYPPLPPYPAQHAAAPAEAHQQPPQIGAPISTLFLIAALFAAAAELVYRIAPRAR